MAIRVLALCSLGLCVAGVLLQASAIVSAGPNENARILVHLTTPDSKNACYRNPDPPNCYEIETRGQLNTDYAAYVFLSNVSWTAGVGGLEFGITYDGVPTSGVEITSWTSCADLESPSAGWPAAGTGNRLRWSLLGCLPTVVGGTFVAGYFWLDSYTPDEFRVTQHPTYKRAMVSSCDLGSEDVLDYGIVNPFGWAVFSADGGTFGSNPCGVFLGSCHISGPTIVDSGQTGIEYTMDPDEVTATGFWYVGGNAEITSSNDSTATINATSPGTFRVSYRRSPDCFEVCGCSIEVQVLGPVAVHRTTWGRIKATLATTKPN